MNTNIENSLEKINNKLDKLIICDNNHKNYELQEYIKRLEGLITPEIINDVKLSKQKQKQSLLSRQKQAELEHIRRISSQKKGGRRRYKTKRYKKTKRKYTKKRKTKSNKKY